MKALIFYAPGTSTANKAPFKPTDEDKYEDMLDLIIIESRKNEPRISWEKVKKQLRKNKII